MFLSDGWTGERPVPAHRGGSSLAAVSILWTFGTIKIAIVIGKLIEKQLKLRNYSIHSICYYLTRKNSTAKYSFVIPIPCTGQAFSVSGGWYRSNPFWVNCHCSNRAEDDALGSPSLRFLLLSTLVSG